MDSDTQHQNSTNASDDWEEKEYEEEGDKLNHNGQVVSNGLKGEPVDTENISLSVVQERKKKTSVPIWPWRLVSVTILFTLILLHSRFTESLTSKFFADPNTTIIREKTYLCMYS